MSTTVILISITLILTIWNIWLTFATQVLHHYQNSMEQELKASIELTDLAVSIVVKDNYKDTDDFYNRMDEAIKPKHK